MDTGKRLVNPFFAGSTFIAWYIFGNLFAMVFAGTGMRDHHLLGKQLTSSTLLGAVCAVVLLFWIWRHARYRPIIDEVGDELVKVTWPDWEETRSQTGI